MPSRSARANGFMADERAGEPEPSPEELLRQLKVADLLLGTLVSLVQLGYAKLGEGETAEARLTIETLRVVTPVLEGSAPDDALRDLRQATANLQLAYADKVKTAAEPSSDGEEGA
jgi:hypothetical protein